MPSLYHRAMFKLNRNGVARHGFSNFITVRFDKKLSLCLLENYIISAKILFEKVYEGLVGSAV